MTLHIFQIDDGGETFWYAANDHTEADRLFALDFGEVEDPGDHFIVMLQPLVANRITVTDHDNQEPCPSCEHRNQCPKCGRRGQCNQCHGHGSIPRVRTVLEWFSDARAPCALGGTVF